MARINTKDGFMWRNAAEKSGYRASKVAINLGISRRQLYRYTIKTFGQSPQEWLNDARLATAGERLIQIRFAKEVAAGLGFKQLSHFSREFKRYYGVSPTVFLSLSYGKTPVNRNAATAAIQDFSKQPLAGGQEG